MCQLPEIRTQKSIATSNHGASNVPATTLQISATEKKDQTKFDASSVAEITQRTTKDAPFTKTFKRKYTLLSDPRHTSDLWNHTLPSRKTINPYTQPGVTYAQITKQNTYAPLTEQEPHLNLSHQQTSDTQELTI
jgi:hypothetical protein